ncbi:MAG: hypothetical protein AAFR61_00145 [Bacteroidota bacterium]
MRIAFTALFLGFCLPFLYSQALNDLTEVSADHQQLQGTNVYMAPPEGFEHSETMKGFKSPDYPNAMIMLVEVPGPYAQVSAGFSQTDMMKARGMELLSKEAVMVGGLTGVLLKLEQEAMGMVYRKHILVYGNEQTTTLINAVFLKEKEELDPLFEASIRSTFVQTDLKIDPREALPYAVDESLGKLQFISVMGNGMLFNRDKKTPTQSEDKASLIVDRSFAKVDVPNKGVWTMMRLDKLPDPMEPLEEPGLEEVELAGLKGYSIYGQNKKDQDEEVYLIALFPEEGGYFIMIGSYHKDFPQARADVQAVINSFRLKE